MKSDHRMRPSKGKGGAGQRSCQSKGRLDAYPLLFGSRTLRRSFDFFGVDGPNKSCEYFSMIAICCFGLCPLIAILVLPLWRTILLPLCRLMNLRITPIAVRKMGAVAMPTVSAFTTPRDGSTSNPRCRYLGLTTPRFRSWRTIPSAASPSMYLGVSHLT